MCDDCQNALVGIVRQGFVCQRKKNRNRIFIFQLNSSILGCKLICHPDCMEKISTPCRPSIKDRSKNIHRFFFFLHFPFFSGRTILLDQHIVRVCLINTIKLL